jgi:HSP20 family protein
MNIIPRDNRFDISHVFSDLFLNEPLKIRDGLFEPRVDIIDKDDCYVFVAELPGVAKEDIDVNLENGILTIEAKVSDETESEEDNVIRRERKSGFFSRSINIGKEVKASDIKTELVNGLLKLTAPKFDKEVNDKHKIEIL